MVLAHAFTVSPLRAFASSAVNQAARRASTRRRRRGSIDPVTPIRLTLITRRDCHLCEEMADVLEQTAPLFGAQIEVADVDSSAELLARYSNEVPVLLVEGRKAFKYRVTRRELERRLRAEQRRARLREWRARLIGGPST